MRLAELLKSLIYLSTFVCCVSGIVWKFGLLVPLEQVALDQKKRIHSVTDNIDSVSIVAIDESSLRDISGTFGVSWPWPREYHALVLNYLAAAGARLVVFDLLLDSQDKTRLDSASEESDASFAEALEESGIGILAAHLRPTDQCETGLGAAELTPVVLPLSAFVQSALSVADTRVVPDDDGVLRRIPLFGCHPTGQLKPGLALSSYLALDELDELQTVPVNLAASAKRDEKGGSLSALGTGSFELSWYGQKSAENQRPFHMLRYVDVLNSAIANLNKRPDLAPLKRNDLKNRIFFIGATAAGLADIKSTPTGTAASGKLPLAGVEVHATGLNNLLERRFIYHANAIWVLGAAFTLIVLIVTVTLLLKPLLAMSLSFAALAGTELLTQFLFADYSYVLPSMLLIGSGLFAAIVGGGARYFIEERERRFIRNAFGQYVQHEVVEAIAKNPDLLKLGGERRELTVMFSDLTGFTEISEFMSPEELIYFMNEYLAAMTDLILGEAGTLDKYIGDAIMAIWGAPLDRDDHASLACTSVLRQLECFDILRASWLSTGGPAPNVRFGVHSGEMIVGNVGGHRHFSYTVMGDNVNLGARLEPLNKRYGTRVIISAATREAIGEAFICRELDKIIVKGRSQPVGIFELLSDSSEQFFRDPLLAYCSAFEQALHAYYERDWGVARELMQQFSCQYPDDLACKLFIDRIDQYLKSPPPETWDGSFTYTDKS